MTFSQSLRRGPSFGFARVAVGAKPAAGRQQSQQTASEDPFLSASTCALGRRCRATMGRRHACIRRTGESASPRRDRERLHHRQGAFEFLERALALRLRPCLCICFFMERGLSSVLPWQLGQTKARQRGREEEGGSRLNVSPCWLVLGWGHLGSSCRSHQRLALPELLARNVSDVWIRKLSGGIVMENGKCTQSLACELSDRLAVCTCRMSPCRQTWHQGFILQLGQAEWSRRLCSEASV